MIKDKQRKQDLVNELFSEAMQELRKQMFGRKHTKVLYRNIRIVPASLPVQTLGRYRILKTKNKYKFFHKIQISNRVLTDYLWMIDHLTIKESRYMKKWRKSRTKEIKKSIKDTIKHELIHAFVKEKFIGNYSYYLDASPIFLSILNYLNIPSGHKAENQYKHSSIKRYLMDVKSFDDLLDELIMFKIEYDDKFRSLEITNTYNDMQCFNYFDFNQGDNAGLIACTTIIGADENKKLFKYNFFEIGCNITPYMIKKLVKRKIMNNNFKEKKYNEIAIEPQTPKDLKINRLKLQSMNI